MFIVTGGAGFIGSNLVAALNAEGPQKVVVVDQLGTDEKWRNLLGATLWDFVRPEHIMAYLEAYVEEITHVFHLGAISATTERDANLIINTNFALSRDLWNWCALEQKSFIYASSAATYGDGSAGFKDGLAPESLAQLRPLNAYGWSKHLFDRFVSIAVQQGEATPAQYVGLKFFNVYGPHEHHKGSQASVVGPFLRQARTTGVMRLFKSYKPGWQDGAQERDFVWVGDCVDLMLWLRDHPEVNGLFNVGTGQARTFEALARSIASSAGVAATIEYIDMPEDLRAQYQYHTQADLTALRAAGYTAPFTSLEAGIEKYVKEIEN